MNEITDEGLARLEIELAEADKHVVATAKTWAATQAAYLHDLLIGEGRLTVVNQAEITEKVQGDVSAIRGEVNNVSDAAAAAFHEWARTVDSEIARSAAQNPTVQFRALSKPFHEAFGDIFIRYGYDPGPLSKGTGKRAADWAFYIPETGTARSTLLSSHGASTDELSGLWSRWVKLSGDVSAARANLQRQKAARLWDE